MLLDPGGGYDYNGEQRTYPDIRLIYWAGGNPFHHHQDLNRLVRAWRRPETIVVQEAWWNPLARHADIVLPVTTQLERNDLACSSRDRLIAASHQVCEPHGEARNDYWIFAALSRRLGVEATFTDRRSEEDWIRHLYDIARTRAQAAGMSLPDFDTFWRSGPVLLPEPNDQPPLFSAFRHDPDTHRLPTPSGRIEIFSQRIASFGYTDCPGHPSWLEPTEWLGAPQAARFALHLISNQPTTKLHSQYDNGSYARAAKIQGREPVRIHPQDAAARNISNGDIVRLFNERGSCFAGAIVSDEVMPGVVQLATGAWYDPEHPDKTGSVDKHGNPNVLTRDAGTSRLAQGPIAHSCLVDVERYIGTLPGISAYDPPLTIPLDSMFAR
jgi:biotin/methionine sulfoxide reductase